MELVSQESVDSFFRKNDIDIVIHGATKPGHRNAKDASSLLLSNTKNKLGISIYARVYKKNK